MPPREENEDWLEYAIRTSYLSNLQIEQALSSAPLGNMYREQIEHAYRRSHPEQEPTNEVLDRTRPVIAPSSRSSSFSGGFRVGPNTSPQFFDEGDSPKASLKKKMAQKVSDVQIKRIREGAHRIATEQENRSRERLRNNGTSHGNKKSDYLNMLRSKKIETRSALQILNTEIPIQLSYVPSRRWGEIAKMGYCNEVSYVGETGRAIYFCAVCTVQTNTQDDYFFQLGHLYCGEHVPNTDYCISCKGFREDCKQIETFDKQIVWACTSCLHNRTRCGRCSESIGPEFIERRRCLKCVNTEFDGEAPYRKFSFGLKWTGEEMGKIYKSKRMWSCELEALSPLKDWAYHLIKLLPKEMGVGQDGSVGVRNQSPFGFEVQTPRISGKRGEELIERILAGIKEVKPKLDETCGMHIHLDGKGIMPNNRREYPKAMVQLMKSYVVFEDVIMSFLPYSRRGNDYCRPLAESLQLSEIDTIETLQDLEQLWYKEETHNEIREAKGHHYHSSRYFGANFHSLLANRHFEVRFHSGTLNKKKILEWANLHALILDACAEGKITSEFIKEYLATSRINERTNLLFEKIGMVETSKQWFRERQKLFGNKKNEEDEVKNSGRKTNASPLIEELQASVSNTVARELMDAVSQRLVVDEPAPWEIDDDDN